MKLLFLSLIHVHKTYKALEIRYKELHFVFIRRAHEEVILPVGNQKISVDEGYGKLIRRMYGINNYLSIPWLEKLRFLVGFAQLSYELVENETVNENELLKRYHRSFAQRLN